MPGMLHPQEREELRRVLAEGPRERHIDHTWIGLALDEVDYLEAQRTKLRAAFEMLAQSPNGRRFWSRQEREMVDQALEP